MMPLSLVDSNRLKKDPRRLAYLYPKMPVGRYKELTEDYHRSITIQTMEHISAMFDAVLLPASCVHHKRRRPERRILLYGRSYYVFDVEDLTDLERAKYRALCASETISI